MATRRPPRNLAPFRRSPRCHCPLNHLKSSWSLDTTLATACHADNSAPSRSLGAFPLLSSLLTARRPPGHSTLLVAEFWAYDALLAAWDDLQELTKCRLFSSLLTTRHHSSYSALFPLFSAVLATRHHSNFSMSCWKPGGLPVNRRISALAARHHPGQWCIQGESGPWPPFCLTDKVPPPAGAQEI